MYDISVFNQSNNQRRSVDQFLVWWISKILKDIPPLIKIKKAQRLNIIFGKIKTFRYDNWPQINAWRAIIIQVKLLYKVTWTNFNKLNILVGLKWGTKKKKNGIKIKGLIFFSSEFNLEQISRKLPYIWIYWKLQNIQMARINYFIHSLGQFSKLGRNIFLINEFYYSLFLDLAGAIVFQKEFYSFYFEIIHYF